MLGFFSRTGPNEATRSAGLAVSLPKHAVRGSMSRLMAVEVIWREDMKNNGIPNKLDNIKGSEWCNTDPAKCKELGNGIKLVNLFVDTLYISCNGLLKDGVIIMNPENKTDKRSKIS